MSGAAEFALGLPPASPSAKSRGYSAMAGSMAGSMAGLPGAALAQGSSSSSALLVSDSPQATSHRSHRSKAERSARRAARRNRGGEASPSNASTHSAVSRSTAGAASAAAAAGRDAKPLRGSVVYVCDDDVSTRSLMGRLVRRRLGASVELFADGRDLMQRLVSDGLRAQSAVAGSEVALPALLMVDNRMPRLGAAGVLKEVWSLIRQDSWPAELARCVSSEQGRIQAAGAVDSGGVPGGGSGGSELLLAGAWSWLEAVPVVVVTGDVDSATRHAMLA